MPPVMPFETPAADVYQATRAVIIDRGKVVLDSPAKDSAARDAYTQYIRVGLSR